MPNILKRPMFRKGGEVTEGIVSLATPRKNYADGPSLGDIKVEGGSLSDIYGAPQTGYPTIKENITYDVSTPKINTGSPEAAIIAELRKKIEPKPGSSFRNLLTGIASTAPADPTQLQTIGSVIARGAAAGTALDQRDIEALKQFDTQAAMQTLKNMSKQDQEKVTAAMTNAKEFARTNYENYPGNTVQEKMQNAYKAKFAELLSREKAVTSEREQIYKIKDLLDKDETIKVSNTVPMATTKHKLSQGKIIDLRTGKPITNTSKRSLRPNEIIISEETGTAIINPKSQNVLKNVLTPNDAYINQFDGAIYVYEGNNKFKRIYP